MKTLSFLNLKGGVAKTISAINFAHILATVHGKRVLIVDNDGQANASRFYGAYNAAGPCVADMLTAIDGNTLDYIMPTAYDNISIIPASLKLLTAEKQMTMNNTRPQQYMLRAALEQVKAGYDYCVIDNSPSLGLAVINAIYATDDILIPVKVDRFTFDGVEQILRQIAEVKRFDKQLGEQLRVAGAFITMYARNRVNKIGMEDLRAQAAKMPEPLHLFDTAIRQTVRIQESTFKAKPILEHAKNSTAAKDYLALVEEYMNRK